MMDLKLSLKDQDEGEDENIWTRHINIPEVRHMLMPLTSGGVASLCLAGVLVDDVGGDGLLLLLLPHQQDALVDEHVLLLHTTTEEEEVQPQLLPGA